MKNRVNELKEKYEYYNLFNLDRNLADLLARIISEREKDKYSCKVIVATCLQHNKTVYTEVINNFQYNWHGKIEEYSSKGGVETSTIQIEEKKHTYFVIYKKNYEELINNIKFKSDNSIEDYLSKITIFYDKCANVIKVGSNKNSEKIYTIDISKFEQQFPYLKEVFYILNKWRYENDRTMLDKNVLDVQIQKLKK